MGKHKRGGAYKLDIADTVCNWNGQVLDKQCLQELKLGDVVRIRFIYDDGKWQNKYVEIRRIFGDHFIGTINDPYSNEYKLYCNKCNEWIDPRELYCCEG